jgi:hypothetical protein
MSYVAPYESNWETNDEENYKKGRIHNTHGLVKAKVKRRNVQ